MAEVTQELNAELEQARLRLNSDLSDLVQLRPMPAVAVKLMDACRKASPDMKAIIQLIECDSAIAMRVLAMANSSIYGYSREIVSLNQALVVLGFRSLSELAASIATGQVFAKGEVARKPRLELYEHSLGCATVARLLTSLEPKLDSNSAFLAGLLHDVGKLVFLDLAPDTYTSLQPAMKKTSSVEQEQAAFGMTHTEVGEFYAEAWSLPAEINFAISHHHDKSPQPHAALPKLIGLANGLAKSWGVGQPADDEPDVNIDQWLLQQDESILDELRETAINQLEVVKSVCMN